VAAHRRISDAEDEQDQCGDEVGGRGARAVADRDHDGQSAADRGQRRRRGDDEEDDPDDADGSA
jgi:hypothetical protein